MSKSNPVYIIPHFNLNINIWRNNHDPLIDPPDVQCLGQLRMRKDAFFGIGISGGVGNQLLILPKNTDIRCSLMPGNNDWIEIPAGSGLIYNCIAIGWQGRGFANESMVALVSPHYGDFPEPLP